MSYKSINPESIHLPLSAKVSLTYMGNTCEIKYLELVISSAHTTRLSKEEYMVNSTGEIKQYATQKSKNRKEASNSLMKTFQNLRRLIMTNVTDNKMIRWVTLTYAENIQDPRQIYNDFRKFIMRFHTYCGSFEYIACLEPQGRGAFHWHCLFIFTDRPAPFIPNCDLEKIWRHGFVKITSLKSADNVASYLCSYLTNAEISPDFDSYFDPKEIIKTTSGSKQHHYVKNSRLNMYPPYLNIVRHSRGIKQPLIQQMSLKEALEKVNGMSIKYQSCGIFSDNKGFSTLIKKVEYQKKN